MKHKNILLASAILVTCFGTMQVHAADVPAGVKLAAKQELVKGGGDEPSSLDPQKLTDQIGSIRAQDLFEGLYNLGKGGKLIPGVAESYTTTDNNTVYTFKLRSEAKWSDGSPVTAEDFVFGFERAVDPATASSYASYIAVPSIVNAQKIIDGQAKPNTLGVKALDDHTFQVTLEHPTPYFLSMTTFATMFPAPKKVIQKWGEDWTNPKHIISNGAYKFNEYIINERMVFVRNHDYWNDKKTIINKVTVLPIKNVSLEFRRYQAGDIDFTSSAGIPPDRYKSLLKDIPDQVKISPLLSTTYYSFNSQKVPFDDVRVRKALSYAIDRDTIAKYVLDTGEVPSYLLTPSGIQGINLPTPKYTTWTQKQRNKKAQELLKEAGFDKSHPLNFTLLHANTEIQQRVTVAIAAMWKKTLGVTATLEKQEWKTFIETRQLGNFEVAYDAWGADYNEASTFLNMMVTDSPTNNANYSNANYDKLMADAATMNDPTANYVKAEQQLINTDMAVAPLFQGDVKRLVKPYVGGYSPNSQDINYTRDLYIIAH